MLTITTQGSKSSFSVLVIVGEDDVYVTGTVAELGICQYDT